MAAMTRQSGMLPTVRCSDCSAEIEISRMGDHICSGVPEPPRQQPPSNRWRSDSATFSARSQSPQSSISSGPPPKIAPGPGPSSSPGPGPAPGGGSTFPRTGRMPPPRIDPSAANRPFAPRDQLAPSNLGPNARSKSPATPSDGRKTPLRSATSPLPRMANPPSPELSNLDCAFPPFPMSNSPRVTPTDPKRSTPTIDTPEASPMFAPMSPKMAGGNGNVLQRMNTIAPGPFGVKNTPITEEPSSMESKPGHKRNGTVGSSKDYTRAPSVKGDRSHFPRPSTAGSEKSHSSSVSSGSGMRRNYVDEPPPALPTAPFPLPTESTGGYGGMGRPKTPGNDVPPPDPAPIANRSQTFPLNEPPSMADAPSGPLPRRPSEPAFKSQQRRPTVGSSGRPNLNTDVPRVPSGEEAGPSPRDAQSRNQRYPPRSASRADQRDQKWPSQPPPVPTNNDYAIGNPYHTPRESHSSSGSSYGSDIKTGSSRSSPPLSDVPEHDTRQPSKPASIDNLMSEIQTSMQDFGPGLGPPGGPPGSRRPPPSAQQPRSPNVPLSPFPESPLDPAIRGGYFQRPSFDDSSQAGSETPKTEASLSPKRRPTAAVKGNCRGCGEPIRGKSVSSADGQLTGRYHKHCQSKHPLPPLLWIFEVP
ncbi:MAG: hypothetical protein M4579_002097 [Chaenotheca gracillima]|nr:MAG: hypothetical protein M4579_002097 [Chaenotheca gracillima]